MNPFVRQLFVREVKGGQGSGNFGHEGRPGEVGGSGEGGDGGGEKLSIPEYVDKFGEKPGDNVHAKFRFEHYVESRRAVEQYLGGVKPDATFTNGKFTAVILPSGRELYLKEGDPRPAPAGNWQGWWDEDLEEVAGISKEQYGKLPLSERIMADAKVQAIKYAPSEFEDLQRDFWQLPGKKL